MLVFIVTITLALIAIGGWFFLKRDPDRYIHEKKSPMNFFFKWGRIYHHFFKLGIIIVLMFLIFHLYKNLLNTSNIFATIVALIAGIVLPGGKELLDKHIQADDIFSSLLGIVLGLFIIILFFW